MIDIVLYVTGALATLYYVLCELEGETLDREEKLGMVAMLIIYPILWVILCVMAINDRYARTN